MSRPPGCRCEQRDIAISKVIDGLVVHLWYVEVVAPQRSVQVGNHQRDQRGPLAASTALLVCVVWKSVTARTYRSWRFLSRWRPESASERLTQGCSPHNSPLHRWCSYRRCSCRPCSWRRCFWRRPFWRRCCRQENCLGLRLSVVHQQHAKEHNHETEDAAKRPRDRHDCAIGGNRMHSG